MKEMSPEDKAMRLELAQRLIERLRAVRSHWDEGLTAAQSAERLAVSQRLVEYLRRYMGLTRGQAWRGGVKPLGRSVSLQAVVMEVRR